MTEAERNKALIAAYVAERRNSGVLLCSGCTKRGSCRLGVLKEELRPDDTYSATVICGAENEAGPNVAHGGWTDDMNASAAAKMRPCIGVNSRGVTEI